MQELEAELERARTLDVGELADAIETIGFECTRCGACCKSDDDDPHTATVFPDEVRELTTDGDEGREGDEEEDNAQNARDWRDVARPMPYGLDEDGTGETFEWALQTDACGNCTFYEEGEASETPHGDGEAVGADGTGACTVHEDRPLICETYPFSVALGGTSQPMGEAVDSVALPGQREAGETGDEAGMVRAHECEGLGRDIDRGDAEAMAAALRERAVRELEEAIAVRDSYEPGNLGPGETVVHDSEGAKNADGTPYEG